MKNITPKIKNSKDSGAEMSEKTLAAIKLAYYKQGVQVASLGLSNKFYAFAFEIKLGGQRIRTIIANGKLTRAERRKVVSEGLLAFKFDQLEDMDFLRIHGVENVRGFIYGKGGANV